MLWNGDDDVASLFRVGALGVGVGAGAVVGGRRAGGGSSRSGGDGASAGDEGVVDRNVSSRPILDAENNIPQGVEQSFHQSQIKG